MNLSGRRALKSSHNAMSNVEENAKKQNSNNGPNMLARPLKSVSLEDLELGILHLMAAYCRLLP